MGKAKTGRTKLSDAEKQKRKAQREQVRADKLALKRRRGALQRLMAEVTGQVRSQWVTLLSCSGDTACLRCEDEGRMTYENLVGLSLIFITTKINIGLETDYCYDTFGGPYESSHMIITIDGINWDNIDNV